jgi:membrane-associated phospholipid phosphatase
MVQTSEGTDLSEGRNLHGHAQVPGLLTIVFSRFWFKAFGTTGFTFVFFAVYLYLLKHPAFAVRMVPEIAVDRIIAFEPAALPVYLSLWFYVSLPPVLMMTRNEIVSYGVRIGVLCLIALGIFYCVPNAVPPADIDWARYPGVAFLKQVDMAGNACPSLHVGTAVFSSVWLFWRIRLLRLGRVVQAVNILWCVAIAYSTLAIKQHVFVDVLAGTLLALIMAWLSGLKAHACHLGASRRSR